MTGTFITAKSWLRRLEEHIKSQSATSAVFRANGDTTPLRNVSLVIIGSEAGDLGVPGNPDYAASKSAIQHGLTLSLAPDAAKVCPTARVNAVCPGAVATRQFAIECSENGNMKWQESEATVASRLPVGIENIAKYSLFLISEKWSASVTGQLHRIDGGKSGRLYWNQDGTAAW